MEWTSGSIRIRPNVMLESGIERDFKAPAHFLVHADVKHTITATEDDTEFWCVYSHRDAQGNVVQAYTGWESAYV